MRGKKLIWQRKGSASAAPTIAQGWRAWWDAMDASTLFVDAGITPVSSDGQSVYRMTDKLGVITNSYFEQATFAQRPLYKTGGAGEKSYLLFDVVDDNMVSLATSNFFSNNAKTLLLVGNTYGSITDSAAIVRDGSTYWDVRTRTGPLLRFRNYDGTYDESTGAPIALGTPFVYVAKHDGGNLYDAVNSVSWSSAIVSGATTNLTALFNLRPARYHLYSFAVANVVISDTELIKCINYFRAQIGI